MKQFMMKLASGLKAAGVDLPPETLIEVVGDALDGSVTTLQCATMRDPLVKAEDAQNMRMLAMRGIFEAIGNRPEIAQVKIAAEGVPDEKGVFCTKVRETVTVMLLNLGDQE